MDKIYYLTFFLLIHIFSFAQPDLFIKSNAQVPLITNSENSQITLKINAEYFNSIKEVNPCDLLIEIPFFEEVSISLTLESFNPFTNDFQLLRSTQNGLVYDNYQPDINSYRIIGDEMSGSISFMKNFLIGVIKKNGEVYEIKYMQDGLYALFDVNESIVQSNFSCQTITEDIELENDNNPLPQMGGAECVEMAIEIDYYTFLLNLIIIVMTAVEWALALLAGC